MLVWKMEICEQIVVNKSFLDHPIHQISILLRTPGHYSKEPLESDSPGWKGEVTVLLNYFRQQRRNKTEFPRRRWLGGLRGCLRDCRLY